METIKKYTRYAGVWDRLKNLIFLVLIFVGIYYLHYFVSNILRQTCCDIAIFWSHTLANIYLLYYVWIGFVILNVIHYFYKKTWINYRFFKILIVDEKTGKKANSLQLFKRLFYQILFFILPQITVMIPEVVLIEGNVSFISIQDMIFLFFWFYWISNSVLIIMFLIDFIFIFKSPKKQSWYDKKAGVVIVVK